MVGTIPYIAPEMWQGEGASAASDLYAVGVVLYEMVTTDEPISRLARFPSVRVISRTSMMHYKNSRARLPEIANELGVDYVVQGSVEMDESRARIALQLLDARNDRHLWSHRVAGVLSEMPRIQDQLAAAIARELGVVRAPGAPQAESPAAASLAYPLYLRGKFHLDRRDRDGLQRAIEYFGSAVRADSSFALAHSGLADAWSASAFGGFRPPEEAYPIAMSAVLRALAIDPSSSESQSSLGNILQHSQRDWAGSSRAYRRALELNDNNAVAHHGYANQLALRGDVEQAMVEIARARELDPHSLPIGVGRA